MGYGVDQNDRLLQLAADYARDIHAYCADVGTVLFPSAMVPPSEAIISAVSAKLRQIVSDIEFAILKDGAGQTPTTWEMLTRSGFLREPDLIDFMLARVAEDRLSPMANVNPAQIANRLLDHPNAVIVEAGQTLLAADSLHHHSVRRSFLVLTPELLHKMCWRIVAALEVAQNTRQLVVIDAAKTIIADFTEANRAQSAARKIVHFSSEIERSELLKPELAGLHLHVAALSKILNLDHDHVVRLIDSGSSTPYAIMLAAAGVAKADAAKAIYTFRGDLITLHEAGIFDAGYERLQQQHVKAEISKWATARTNYLAFGQL